MRELRSFGSVRDEGREILVYSEFRCALLCSVVPNATGATRILLTKSMLSFNGASYEPGGREFESLRARQIIQVYSGQIADVLYRTHR
jgi:hypothetical protein